MTDLLARLRFVAALAVLGAVLGACASGGTVVLLPEKDGRQTAVSVRQGDKEVVLDQPYAAARTNAQGPRAYVASPQDVNAQFGPALAAQPARSARFTLYFVEGKDEFTDESRKLIDGVLAEIARRPVPDVMVVGHTDTVGSESANDALSRQRAEVVRKGLIARGIAPEDVVAIGRGKRNLLVPTADGVAEPRNRRVEILVR